MIGRHVTGTLPGIVISKVAHEHLAITVDGRPAQLAVVDERGQVVAAGVQVAREAEAVAVNSYRNFLESQGWLRVYSPPLDPLSKED